MHDKNSPDIVIDEEVVDVLIKQALRYEMNLMLRHIPTEDELDEVEVPDALYRQIFQKIISQNKSTLSLVSNDVTTSNGNNRRSVPIRKLVALFVALFVIMVGTLSVSAYRLQLFNSMQEFGESIVRLFDQKQSGLGKDSLANITITETYKKIEKDFGNKILKFGYIPEGYDFDEVIIDDTIGIVKMIISNEDFYFILDQSSTGGIESYGITVDGHVLETVTLNLLGQSITIIAVQINENTTIYRASWLQGTIYYAITSNMDLEQVIQIMSWFQY